MVDSVVNNKSRVLPCACYLDGQYGLKDVYVGVPARLGCGGVEEVIELKLSAREKKALHSSAEEVKANIAKLKF